LSLLPKVVEAGVNSTPDTFQDVDFSIADTKKARAIARKAAIEDAVDKARIYAEGAGASLGRLLLVEEGGSNLIAQSGNRGLRFRAEAVADAPVAAPSIAPEPQLYTAEVSVVFAIAGATAKP
jgi:uncharacterized protein